MAIVRNIFDVRFSSLRRREVSQQDIRPCFGIVFQLFGDFIKPENSNQAAPVSFDSQDSLHFSVRFFSFFWGEGSYPQLVILILPNYLICSSTRSGKTPGLEITSFKPPKHLSTLDLTWSQRPRHILGLTPGSHLIPSYNRYWLSVVRVCLFQTNQLESVFCWVNVLDLVARSYALRFYTKDFKNDTVGEWKVLTSNTSNQI